MKNQNELSVEKIRTMFLDAGQPFTIEEIKSLLLNKKTKKLVYRLYGARLEIKKIKTENHKLKH